jgi:hypothetical protein
MEIILVRFIVTHNQYMIELFPNAFVDHGANRIHWLQNTLDSS